MPVARIGLMWRGERGAPMLERAHVMLGPLFAAFAAQDVDAEAVVYSDDAVEAVRAELEALDGVVVWVNPIQNGATRVRLDALLRQVSDAGVWVSAHPEVIDRMGTKEVLFATQSLGWGSDTAIYRSPKELAEGFPPRLGRYGHLVVKQARGTGGNGVWKVELNPPWTVGIPGIDAPVFVQRSEPRALTPLEETTLGAFLEDCGACFAWSKSVIDQPYQERLAEGMIRAYLVHDEVVGFCHQWPRGLRTPGHTEQADTLSAVPTMEDPDAPAYASLRAKVECEWVPGMKELLGLSMHELPVIWDADFLYGAKGDAGEDTYVLCEINVQAVWPYPPQASGRLARAALERVLASKHAPA